MTLATVEPAAAPKPSGPSSEERRAWDRIKDASDRGKLRDFIVKYPASPLAETAKTRLDSLDRAVQEREEKARAEREAEQRRGLAAKEAMRKAPDEACERDQDRLTWLRGSVNQGWAREDLKRLERDTTCDRVRSEVVALLAQPPAARRCGETNPCATAAACERPARGCQAARGGGKARQGRRGGRAKECRTGNLEAA
jgi:hypothetical protein